MASDALTCPSATCAPGTQLIGTLGAGGRIKHLRTPLTVDAGFVEAAQAQGDPEARMRFATGCAEGRCHHWRGGACGLITEVLETLEAAQVERSPGLPRCPIRPTCRWHAQEGRTACEACDLVVRQPCAAA